VLHRKECFVAEDYPRRAVFAALTQAEMAAGLLDDSAGIGTQQRWEARLAERAYAIVDHDLQRVIDATVTCGEIFNDPI